MITIGAFVAVEKNYKEVSEWAYAGTINYATKDADLQENHKYAMNVQNMTGNLKIRIISIEDGKLKYIMIVPPAERTLPSNVELRKKIVKDAFNGNPYVVLVDAVSKVLKASKNAVSSTYNVTLSVGDSQALMRSIGMNQSVPTVQLRGTVTFRSGLLYMTVLKSKEGDKTYEVVVKLEGWKK